MKIVATVTNWGSVVCGGDAESRSAIIDIPESLLPPMDAEYYKERCKELETKAKE